MMRASSSVRSRLAAVIVAAGPILSLFPGFAEEPPEGAAATTDSSDEAGAVHTWTSRAGTSVEARFVQGDDVNVVLESVEGRRLVLERTQLSEESLALLAKLIETPASEPPADETENDTKRFLPVHSSGPLQGFHTAYRQPGFIARIDRRGRIVIDALDGDQVVSTKPLIMQPGLGYVITQEWHGRAIESVASDAPPSLQSEQVRLHGTASDGVEWELIYEFKDNRISAWGSATDPRDIEAPTIFQVSCHLPRFEGLDYTMSDEEIRTVVGDSQLSVKKSRGRPLVIDYVGRQLLGRTIGEAEGESELATVRSSLFADRPVTWDPNGTRHGSLLFWSDGNTALWDGYTIYYRNRQAGETSRQSRLTLTIGP